MPAVTLFTFPIMSVRPACCPPGPSFQRLRSLSMTSSEFCPAKLNRATFPSIQARPACPEALRRRLPGPRLLRRQGQGRQAPPGGCRPARDGGKDRHPRCPGRGRPGEAGRGQPAPHRADRGPRPSLRLRTVRGPVPQRRAGRAGVLDRPRRDVGGRPCLAHPSDRHLPCPRPNLPTVLMRRARAYGLAGPRVGGKATLAPPDLPRHVLACLRGLSERSTTLASFRRVAGKSGGSMYYPKGAFRRVLGRFGRTPEVRKPLVF
jgi:hypothetical protein